jgi:hypothetical protein
MTSTAITLAAVVLLSTIWLVADARSPDPTDTGWRRVGVFIASTALLVTLVGGFWFWLAGLVLR